MNQKGSNKKIRRGRDWAFVVHPLDTNGGAEYHLKVMLSQYPEATIVTAWYDPELTSKLYPDSQIKHSFLQHLPFKQRLRKLLVPLHRFAYRSIDLKNFRCIHILSDGFEKHIKTTDDQKTICTVLTPPRFLWMPESSSNSAQHHPIIGKLYDIFLKSYLIKKWKQQDYQAVQRFDLLLANSKAVLNRISRFYNLHSEILYPPVEITKIAFQPHYHKRSDFYLYLGRVEAYKGVEQAVRAAILAKEKLVVAGVGSDLARIQELTNKLKGSEYVEFLGFVSDEKRAQLLQTTRALIYPVADEDFGIVPLEANAAGAPVIAHRSGGVTETIVEGVTGVFFDERTPHAIVEAMRACDNIGIDPRKCRDNAMKYDRSVFEGKLVTIMNGFKKR